MEEATVTEMAWFQPLTPRTSVASGGSFATVLFIVALLKGELGSTPLLPPEAQSQMLSKVSR